MNLKIHCGIVVEIVRLVVLVHNSHQLNSVEPKVADYKYVN